MHAGTQVSASCCKCMTSHFRASNEPRWDARVVARQQMTYRNGPSDEDDRPPHVRAASGLSAFR